MQRTARSFGGMVALAVAILPGCGGPGPGRRDHRPNIVLILADDIGYSDISPYGGEIHTPNLQRLADGGLRFTQHYTENMCVPSRAALLTGVYHTLALDENNTLSPHVVTVAQRLRAAGYSTYMAGKWHLAMPGQLENYPCQRGFEHFFGTIIGAGSYYAPATLTRDNQPAEHEYLRPGFYYTDAITDNAVAYLEEAVARQKPFFLYVAYTAAHWPLHAPEQEILKYRGRYSAGWDRLRLERYQRMRQLGVINPAWALSPRDPQVPPWEKETHKSWQERRMEVYAAQIDRMDYGIGRIVRALDKHGQLDNTLIVFQADNGGCHVEYSPDRQGPHLPAKTREGRPVRPGNLPSIMPGPEDTYQSYGRGWANLSNTPFRLFKQYDHQGGIATPLIVHWPAVIREGGRIVNEISHIIDITPTLLQAAEIRETRFFEGRRVLISEGKSLLSVFRGEGRQGHDALFWKWAHGRAVRRGNYKAVAIDDGPWELYDLEADGTELRDLARSMPEKVTELEALWNAWNRRRLQDLLR